MPAASDGRPAVLELGLAYSIAELLPHGAGFVLLDALLDYGAEHASALVTIGRQSLFFEEGRGVPGWVGIEYMAQTIGAYGGIVRLQAGQPVAIGLLLGTRRYHCDADYFSAGTRLTVRAEQLVRDTSGVVAFDCMVAAGGQVLAQAEIKAYQPDDIEGYLRSLKEDGI
ncbi:MAG: 3-hydroxylacyl-ACP dehydratase [Solimonas sp.]